MREATTVGIDRHRPRTGPPVTRPSATPASHALALQRSVGNRAASRILARWMKHPDPEKKGVMVPDLVASELERFSPPTNE